MVLRGKYEILGKLGAGGMATVYRARHLAFDEIRAIKVVASRLADDEDFLKRFRNEAVVARRLHHPNAVRVEDFDNTEDGRPFIVMEYVDGSNLREKIRRDGAVSLRRAVTIARQVASALSAAHELGIVHRDIKPDNILLTGAGDQETAKVLDFGIAKVKEGFLGGPEAVATRTGTVVGTPQYISPEQAIGRRGDDLDGRADLYSLGVVLYEMVTGRLPFESDTAMGIILQHLQTPPRPPHELRPDLGIPEPLSAVLLQSLQKDRDRRFRTAGAMVAALDAVLALPLPDRAGAVPFATPPPHRPATPQPVPADIEDRETRAMPRTPPAGSPDTRAAIAMGGAAAAPSLQSPPPGLTLPPIPATPPPAGATPPPMARTLPPLPMMSTQIGSAPRRKKRRWLVWTIASFFIWVVFIRRSDRAPRARDTPSPAPSAEAAPAIAGADEDADVKDARLRAEVQRALYDSPKTRTQPITVDVDEGQVTLEGRTATMEAAIEAEVLARRVPGVTEVRNRIEHPEPPDARAFPHIQISIPPIPFRNLIPKEAVEEMVKEGRQKLESEEYEAALHIFQAALALDPRHKEAREGLQEASRQIRDRAREERQRARDQERQRERVPPSGRVPAPPAPPPPSPEGR
jgi:serine/threonine protein kinase